MNKLKRISIMVLLGLIAPMTFAQQGWVEIINYCSRQTTPLNVQLHAFTGSGCPNTMLSQPISYNSSYQFDSLNNNCKYWDLSFGSHYYVVPTNTTVTIGNGFTSSQGCVCVSGCIAAKPK